MVGARIHVKEEMHAYGRMELPYPVRLPDMVVLLGAEEKRRAPNLENLKGQGE